LRGFGAKAIPQLLFKGVTTPAEAESRHESCFGHSSGLAMTEFLAAKIALLVVVGFATLAASLLPWGLTRCLVSRRALDGIAIASAASAGIVAGAFLCHLLPDANEAFADYFAPPDDADGGSSDGNSGGSALADYPFAGLLCGVVLTLLVIIDGVIVRKGMAGDGHGHGHSEGEGAEGAGSHDHITASLKALLVASETAPAGSKGNYGTMAAPAPSIGGTGAPGGAAAARLPMEVESSVHATPARRRDAGALPPLSPSSTTIRAIEAAAAAAPVLSRHPVGYDHSDSHPHHQHVCDEGGLHFHPVGAGAPVALSTHDHATTSSPSGLGVPPHRHHHGHGHGHDADGRVLADGVTSTSPAACDSAAPHATVGVHDGVGGTGAHDSTNGAIVHRASSHLT